MTAQHLGDDGLRHRIEIEGADFLAHAGMEHDLEQQVAQLVLQPIHVFALDRVGHLIGFFDRIGGDCFERLRQIPGTAAIDVAQSGHDRQKAVDRSAGAEGGIIEHQSNIADDTADARGFAEKSSRQRKRLPGFPVVT
jgi:hypothetical protein